MSEDFHLEPLPADADTGDLLEALGPIEERPPESQYCVFRSGRERFCLPVLDVEEVLDWPLLTKLPLGPAYLIGIFNLRGAIVPLIDIAITEGRRQGLLPKHVVVASLQSENHHEDIRIGIAADENRWNIDRVHSAKRSLLRSVGWRIRGPHSGPGRTL